MAVTTNADVPQLLKRRYGNIGQAVPTKWNLFKWLQEAPRHKFDGRDFLFPVILSPGGAATTYSAGGKFPGVVNPVIRDASLSPVRLATTVAFDEQMLVSGKSDAAGFLGNTDKIVELNVESFKRKLNIQLYGCHTTTLANGAVPNTASRNGIINRVSAVVGAPVTSITVNRPLGYEDADLGSTRHARYLLQNDVFAYGTIAGVTFTVKGSLQVTDVDYSTNTATVTVLSSPGGQPAANDFLCYCDPDDANVNGYGNSVQGLGTLIYQEADLNGAQAIEGITVQPNNIQGWFSRKVNSAGPFDQAQWHDVVRGLEAGSMSGSKKVAMIMDPTMADVYASTLYPDVRLAPQKPEGGRAGVPAFASGQGDITQIFDDKCPYGMTFFLTKEQAFWLTLANQTLPGWYSVNGTPTGWKQLQMQDGLYNNFRWVFNLGYQTLNSHAVSRRVTVANAPL